MYTYIYIQDQLFEDEVVTNERENNETSIRLNEADVSSSRLDGDGFGDEFGRQLFYNSTIIAVTNFCCTVIEPELFGDELFGEPPRIETVNPEGIEAVPNVNDESDDDGSDRFDIRAPSPVSSCEGSPAAILKEGNVKK